MIFCRVIGQPRNTTPRNIEPRNTTLDNVEARNTTPMPVQAILQCTNASVSTPKTTPMHLISAPVPVAHL